MKQQNRPPSQLQIDFNVAAMQLVFNLAQQPVKTIRNFAFYTLGTTVVLQEMVNIPISPLSFAASAVALTAASLAAECFSARFARDQALRTKNTWGNFDLLDKLNLK